MGIFGSYARREATEQSDLDVFFETDTPNLFTTSRLRIELQEFLGLPIDLVRFRDNMNPRLKAHIMNEGVYV
jgi:predicted nucleotidyltransferase